MYFLIRLNLTLCIVSLAFSVAFGQTTAVTNIVAPTTWGGDYCLGWEFTVNSPITVTQLGVFDEGSNGLAGSHAVGIFRVSDQALLVSTTITTSNALDTGFRYGSVTPTALAAGASYRIGAVYATGVDAYAENCTSFVTAPAVTFVDECYQPGASLAFPTQQQGPGIRGYFTANFKFEGASIPEPGALTFFMFGGALVLLKYWRYSVYR